MEQDNIVDYDAKQNKISKAMKQNCKRTNAPRLFHMALVEEVSRRTTFIQSYENKGTWWGKKYIPSITHELFGV